MSYECYELLGKITQYYRIFKKLDIIWHVQDVTKDLISFQDISKKKIRNQTKWSQILIVCIKTI